MNNPCRPPRLLHETLEDTAGLYPDKMALINGTERVTYRELENRSNHLSGVLRDMGVRRHDRVVVFLDNPVEAVVSLYGICKADATFVILNGTMKAKKLGYILNDSGASALITHTGKRGIVEDALRELTKSAPSVLWFGDPAFVSTPAKGAKAIFSENIDQDLAALIYTSGSTGEPKGVMSTHLNMMSAARSIIQYIGNRSDDIIVDVLPLSFDYGLYQVIMGVMFGGTVVFESFQFPVKVLQIIEKERVTGFPLVPTVAAFLLKLKDLSKFDLSSLRYMTNTGAALPVEHIRRLRGILPQVKLFSMFGLTECKRVSYLPPEEIDRRPASVGKAIPNCEVFILDDEGRELGPEEVGELVIRGSNVMRGYWNAPELTARTYRPGRIPGEIVLYSGDYFRKDEEGFLYFLGRKDDMIKTKGERVSPKEMENALSAMPGVAEVAVIGVPDEILGQAIKVFIVRKAETDVFEKDVKKFCSGSLESFMLPKYVEFLDELPKSSHGKIDKSALKAVTP